ARRSQAQMTAKSTSVSDTKAATLEPRARAATMPETYARTVAMTIRPPSETHQGVTQDPSLVSAVLNAMGRRPVAAASHITAAPTIRPPDARTIGGSVSFSLAVMKK